MRARLTEGSISLSGFSSVHSHAFQRALRGRTQRPSTQAKTFWSWRGLMYDLAMKLDAESIYALSHLAYVELAKSGVTTVGEFHYIHHQPDGTPYADRIELADAVIRAARDAGLRIVLLRTLYERAGASLAPEPGQRRFCDARVDDAFADIEALEKRFASNPFVTVGIAPHSVRAVRKETLRDAIAFARNKNIPLHMHVSEQPREIDECLAEHGVRPVHFLEEMGALEASFTAIHATHLLDDEIAKLGQARAFAAICRTTERDLGDGLSRAADLHRAGVRLCTGIDSHAVTDIFEELRAIELDERSRHGKRHAALDATELLEAGIEHAYASLGLGSVHTEDEVVLDRHDMSLLGVSAETLDDLVVYAARPAAVREVSVAGETVVREGQHAREEGAKVEYLRALQKLTA